MGERNGAREQMDRFVGHLVSHGMPVDRAKEIARKEAIKQDNGQGVKRPN